MSRRRPLPIIDTTAEEVCSRPATAQELPRIVRLKKRRVAEDFRVAALLGLDLYSALRGLVRSPKV